MKKSFIILILLASSFLLFEFYNNNAKDPSAPANSSNKIMIHATSV